MKTASASAVAIAFAWALTGCGGREVTEPVEVELATAPVTSSAESTGPAAASERRVTLDAVQAGLGVVSREGSST